jgi:hypothetical protein
LRRLTAPCARSLLQLVEAFGASCTSSEKSAISCTWRISMTSFSVAGHFFAQAIASSRDFTLIIQ